MSPLTKEQLDELERLFSADNSGPWKLAMLATFPKLIAVAREAEQLRTALHLSEHHRQQDAANALDLAEQLRRERDEAREVALTLATSMHKSSMEWWHAAEKAHTWETET